MSLNVVAGQSPYRSIQSVGGDTADRLAPHQSAMTSQTCGGMSFGSPFRSDISAFIIPISRQGYVPGCDDPSDPIARARGDFRGCCDG